MGASGDEEAFCGECSYPEQRRMRRRDGKDPVLRPSGAPLVSGVAGFASPCSTPWDVGGAVSTSVGGLNRGARFFFRAVGPNRTWGSCPGECCVRRVAAQPYDEGWLAERPDSGQRLVHNAACAYRSNAHA